MKWGRDGRRCIGVLTIGQLVEMQLPPVLRSLHQAVGTAVWLVYVAFAALAWRGMRQVPTEEPTSALPILPAARIASPPARPHSIAVIIARGADL